jgi:hypothetical protein
VSVHDLLGRLRDAMRTAGVQHMLTGSYASSVHGTPRASQDIDIVIAPTRPQLLALLQLFPDTEYYVSQEAALDALATRGKFNVIDFASGWKIDFIIMKAREFRTEEFARRRPIELEGVELDVASPEDIVVAKLEWAHLGASSRQIEDAAGVIRLQGEGLDRDYIERWVDVLGIREQWNEASAKAVSL